MLLRQRVERRDAIRLRDVVDERDLLFLQIEEPPGVDLIAAAREIVGDHQRVRVVAVRRLNAGADRHHGRADLRLARALRPPRLFLAADRQRDRDDRECQSLASYQLLPHRASTASGTASGWMFSIVSFTIPATSAALASGASITISSCTVSSIRAPRVSRFKRSSSAIMASFSRSAAVPWIGAFVAIRSALPRTVNDLLWISGM